MYNTYADILQLVVGRVNNSELPDLERSKFLFPATATGDCPVSYSIPYLLDLRRHLGISPIIRAPYEYKFSVALNCVQMLVIPRCAHAQARYTVVCLWVCLSVCVSV